MSFFKKNTASTLAAQPIRHPPQTRPCSAAQCADATPSSRARTAKKKTLENDRAERGKLRKKARLVGSWFGNFPPPRRPPWERLCITSVMISQSITRRIPTVINYFVEY